MGIRHGGSDNDILFQHPDWMFSYRVGGLLYRDGKLLLQRNLNDDSYALPGGHVSFGEFSQETLARELMEETGAAVSVGRLCAVVELFWQWRKPCHQINFYYLAELKNKDALPYHNFSVLNDLGEERTDLEMCWIEVDRLDSLTVYPSCLHPYLKNLPEQTLHLQEKDLEA